MHTRQRIVALELCIMRDGIEEVALGSIIRFW